MSYLKCYDRKTDGIDKLYAFSYCVRSRYLKGWRKNTRKIFQCTSGVIKYYIRKYKLDDYRRKFSAVFQDFKIFSFTVKDNILMEDMGETDNEKISEEKERRVWNAIESAEFTDKINQLKEGVNTFMMRDYEKDGIELSGGMQQKLALCRAYYREPKMLILDEPTSMIDPMEEYKMYQGLSRLSDDKTAIFISHRLASSKFCDKIAYLENGRVIEYGTHEELMQKCGKYFALFMKQAQYYDAIG